MMRWFLTALLLFAGFDAVACPLCLGAYRSSAGQALVDMRRAVLVTPASDGSGYRVVEVIKGERPAGGFIAADALQLRTPVATGIPTLLVSEQSWPIWISFGGVPLAYAGMLRQIAEHKVTTEQEWGTRVSLMLPYLENPEPLVAAIAYGEFTAAPYAALLTVKPLLSAPTLRRWLADPQLAARQPLYLLLLGIAGDSRDAEQIERRLDAAWQAGDATSVGSLIGADLQLRGPERVAWVDEKYLLDKKRSTPEIEAALLALSVHGSSNVVIPRERVIASYRKFMQAHLDIAGYVAPDFAAWSYWDAAPDFVVLMKSNVRQQYPSQLAIVDYLRHSPRARDLGFQWPPADTHESDSGRMVPFLPQ